MYLCMKCGTWRVPSIKAHIGRVHQDVTMKGFFFCFIAEPYFSASYHLADNCQLTNFRFLLQMSDIIDNGFVWCICREYVAAAILSVLGYLIIGFKWNFSMECLWFYSIWSCIHLMKNPWIHGIKKCKTANHNWRTQTVLDWGFSQRTKGAKIDLLWSLSVSQQRLIIINCTQPNKQPLQYSRSSFTTAKIH